MLSRTPRCLVAPALAFAAAATAATWATPGIEIVRVDQSGRMSMADDLADAPVHDDADLVTVVVRHAVATAGTPAALKGAGLDFELLSNGLGDEGDTPTDVAYTPDGARIVVANRDSRNLTVLDAASRDVLASIPLSGSPNSLAISSDGVHAVTANIFEDSASIIDLDAEAETAVVAVGDQPGVVRITPDGATAVVGNTVSGSLSIIDIASAAETDVIGGLQFSSITSFNFEHGATASQFTDFRLADNDTLLFPERFNARVQFVDITAGTVTPLPTAANPVALDVSPDGTTAVVSHGSGTQLVSVIDVAGQSVTKTIATGVDLNAGAIVINPDKTKAIVGVLNEVRVVNLVTDAVSANIPTSGINALLRSADGTLALAVGFNGALVSFASESLVTNVNGVVSTNLGAHSPVAAEAALVGAFFTEELLAVTTNGIFGALQERLPSGPPPEGDKARHVAFTPDGTKAVAVNILSDNVSVIDLAGPAVQAIIEVGDRPSEVAITPDSGTAVIANLDSPYVSIVDLNALTATGAGISTRASQVEISPDGQFAYLAVVANGDGVWRVDLSVPIASGPKILTGNMGGIFYLYGQTSGMTLSHDGATLVTCNSFDDNISIIDTAAWTEVLRLPVGDFPVRAVFSADDSLIYVSNKNDDTVSVVANAGAGSTVVTTFAVGDQPFNMAVAPDGSTLYVANFADQTISMQSLTLGAAGGLIALGEPVQDILLNPTGERLYAAGGNWSVTIGPGPAVTLSQSGEFAVIDAVTGDVLEQVATNTPPGNLAYRPVNGLAAMPSPHGDGVVLVDVCPGDLDGDNEVGINDFLLVLGSWGGSGGDANGDGDTDILDFLLVIGLWGECV